MSFSHGCVKVKWVMAGDVMYLADLGNLQTFTFYVYIFCRKVTLHLDTVSILFLSNIISNKFILSFCKLHQYCLYCMTKHWHWLKKPKILPSHIAWSTIKLLQINLPWLVKDCTWIKYNLLYPCLPAFISTEHWLKWPKIYLAFLLLRAKHYDNAWTTTKVLQITLPWLV